MGQMGGHNQYKAPGSAATSVVPVYLEASGSGYGFTTTAADADAAFKASGDGFGIDNATTTHDLRCRKRGTGVLPYEG